MARRSNIWKYLLGLCLLGAIAAGWWLDHRRQSVEVETLRSQVEQVAPQDPAKDSADDLRSENDDLIRFIDESYTLLKEEGFHIQLDLEEDQDGHYRLRADTAELTDELRAKLRELNKKP